MYFIEFCNADLAKTCMFCCGSVLFEQPKNNFHIQFVRNMCGCNCVCFLVLLKWFLVHAMFFNATHKKLNLYKS